MREDCLTPESQHLRIIYLSSNNRSCELEQLWVVGNENQLSRLFSNLIVNALQYTLPGGDIAAAEVIRT